MKDQVDKKDKKEQDRQGKQDRFNRCSFKIFCKRPERTAVKPILLILFFFYSVLLL